MAIRYIPQSELSFGEIHAGRQSGVIRPWRRDTITGEQWYAVGSPDILGVPPDDSEALGEFLIDEPDDNDDDEVEFFETEGDGENA